MKRYINFFVFILFILAGVSCDDFLETKSNSTFTEETIFTNLDFANKAVNSVYNIFTDNEYDYYVNFFFNCDNDIEITVSADDGGRYSLAHYSADQGNSKMDYMWQLLYMAIERANICIKNLPASPIWDGEYSSDAKCLYGEAVTLRAYCFYELIRLWGDVPFPTEPTENKDDFYRAKTDRDSIYEFLVQDLADVEDYVPWMKDLGTTERVNKGFVKGLRARLALTYAGYSLRNKTLETRRGRYWEDYLKIANQECREVMESGKHQLNPSFENIFRTLHNYSQDLTYGESMFEIANGRLQSGRAACTLGMPFSCNPADPKYGRATGEIKVPVSYFYSFDKSDLRRNVSVELYNYGEYSGTTKLGMQQFVNSNGCNFTPCKWRKSWLNPTMGGSTKTASQTGVNWPLMRYSDIVLMFAETENELNGPTSAAKEALSLVRKRAFPETDWASKVTDYVNSVSSSKDAFFNAIVNERAWEFGGEMIRKYDLVRWNLLGSKIREMKAKCQEIVNNNNHDVPDYIYWKYEDDSETLDILNPDYRLPNNEIEGYSRTAWMSVMSESDKEVFNTIMDRVAHGYDEAKNNHLFPLSANIISSSNGLLSNDQIP